MSTSAGRSSLWRKRQVRSNGPFEPFLGKRRQIGAVPDATGIHFAENRHQMDNPRARRIDAVPDQPERPTWSDHTCHLRDRTAYVEPVGRLPRHCGIHRCPGERDLLGRPVYYRHSRHHLAKLGPHQRIGFHGNRRVSQGKQGRGQLPGPGTEVDHPPAARRRPADRLQRIFGPPSVVGRRVLAEGARLDSTVNAHSFFTKMSPGDRRWCLFWRSQ